jgi:hypothetical protein
MPEERSRVKEKENKREHKPLPLKLFVRWQDRFYCPQEPCSRREERDERWSERETAASNNTQRKKGDKQTWVSGLHVLH